MSPAPRSLPTVRVPAGTRIWRIYNRSYDALWFGPAPGKPPRGRFDAPGGEFRICYFGDSPEVAFAETLLRNPGMNLVDRAEVRRLRIARFPVLRDLHVARVHGPGLVRLGISADVAHGHPYTRCQALALDLWEHPASVDGLQFRSRWDNDRLCIALFDRSADALGDAELDGELDDPGLLIPIFHRYRLGPS